MFNRMNNLTRPTFETAYRQLTGVDRVFVDSFVQVVERVSETTGRDLSSVLTEVDVASLPAREQEFLARPLIRVAISERIRDLTEQQNVSARRILKEIASIAFGNIDHFRRPNTHLHYGLEEHEGYDGGLFELDYATPEQRAAVKEVEVEESVRTGKIRTKIKLHDKLGALRALGQIKGLFDQDGNATNAELWASDGAIPIDATVQDSDDIWSRERDAS